MPRKEKKYHFIYKTTDTRNGNFYVGMHSTDNLNDGYVGSGTRLRRLIYKHGKNIFNLEILEFLPTRKLLIEREKELVNSDLLGDNKCMNLKPGGSGGFVNDDHRKKFLNKTKEELSIISKKGNEKVKWLKKNNKEWCEKFFINLSNSQKGNKKWVGKKHSEESKRKIGEANSIHQKGENNSQFGTCWITNGIENKLIKKDLFLTFEAQGWKKGRKMN